MSHDAGDQPSPNQDLIQKRETVRQKSYALMDRLVEIGQPYGSSFCTMHGPPDDRSHQFVVLSAVPDNKGDVYRYVVTPDGIASIMFTGKDSIHLVMPPDRTEADVDKAKLDEIFAQAKEAADYDEAHNLTRNYSYYWSAEDSVAGQTPYGLVIVTSDKDKRTNRRDIINFDLGTDVSPEELLMAVDASLQKAKEEKKPTSRESAVSSVLDSLVGY